MACPSNAQLTPATGGACTSTSDNQGNFGAWILPGSYSYFLTIPAGAGGGTYGPYPISIHGDSGGFTFDANYSTLTAACNAAGSGTLAVTLAWNSLTTQTFACKMLFFGNGKLQAAANQTITMPVPGAPTYQRIFDSTTFSGASFVITGPGDLQMSWWGADPTFTTESGTMIQAALTATTAGQTLLCGRGVYKVSTALNLLAYTNWTGSPTDLQSGADADGGCMLKWAGSAPAVAYATGSAIVNIHGKNGTKLSGINLDGANTTNLTGYMVDAFVGGTSQRNSYEKGFIQHFGDAANDVDGAGMSFGDNDIIAGEQVDGVTASQFFVFDAYIGVRIKNANFAYGQFRNFAIAGINKGFDIEYSGYHTVDNGSFGSMQGTSPSVIYINGPHGPITYNQIQAESDLSPGMDAKFFNITSGTAFQPAAIRITGSTTGFPSVISGPSQKIVSIGNTYAGQTVTLSGSGVFVTSIQDDIPDSDIIISGAQSNWLRVSESGEADGTFMTLVNNFNVAGKPIVNFVQSSTSGKTSASLNYTMQGGQRWGHLWSNTTFCNQDVTASNFSYLCADAGLSGLDGIFIHHGYSLINAIQLQGVASNPLPAGVGGIWALTGVGTVIQGRAAITNLPVGCSGAPAGFLYQDVSGFVKACQ